MIRNPNGKIVSLVSQKPRTFDELEIILHEPARELIRRMRMLRKDEGLKFIKYGSRNVYFKRESQRKEADIMSLGKFALPAYLHIKKYGPKNTEDLGRDLGVGYGQLRAGLFNLVDNGYLKRSENDYKRGGYLYYIKISEKDLRLKTIGWREEQAYKIINSNERPITVKTLAEKMDTYSKLALNVADNLVERGMAYKTKPKPTNKDFKSFREAVYYNDPKKEGLAVLMSVSPKYGEKIYRYIRKRPRTTMEIKRYSRLPRNVVAQVLELFLKHGLVEVNKNVEEQGNPKSWYLGPDSPKI